MAMSANKEKLSKEKLNSHPVNKFSNQELSSYYVSEFIKFGCNPQYLGKFNWAAFSFSFCWAFRRGLYEYSWCFLCLDTLLVGLLFSNFGQMIAIGIAFVQCLFFGIFGNKLVYKEYKKNGNNII